jgi:hypothetical protein
VRPAGEVEVPWWLTRWWLIRRLGVIDAPRSSSEEELTPGSPALPEGTWHPLELQGHAEGQPLRFFLRSLLNARPAPLAPFGFLWLSANEVAPGETLQVRVRLQPTSPLHVRDLSVMLVGQSRWSLTVRHWELVRMHTNRELRAGEVLEFPLERVRIPQHVPDKYPDVRWHLKVESRLENHEELLVRNIPLDVRLHPHDVQQSRSDPEPRGGLPPLLATWTPWESWSASSPRAPRP